MATNESTGGIDHLTAIPENFEAEADDDETPAVDGADRLATRHSGR